MVAILTKYLAPTNTRGARIKAYTGTGLTVTIDYPDGEPQEAHECAARALMRKMSWKYDLVCGGTECGFAFVMLPKVQA